MENIDKIYSLYKTSKNGLTSQQLQEYYERLKEFYKNTKKIEQGKDRKIIRL